MRPARYASDGRCFTLQRCQIETLKQWVRLLDQAKELREFLEENKSKLKLKE